MKDKLHALYRFLQSHSDRPWYPLVIAFLAGLDNLIVVIPTDGILVSSCLLRPKNWLHFAVAVSLGSTLGSLVLVSLVEVQGLGLVESYYPSLLESQAWLITDSLFDKYGLLAVFLVAATPFMQHPVLILAGLANTNLWAVGAVVLTGRSLKYLIFSYTAAKAPQYLNHLWGLQGEIKEVEAEEILDKATHT